jgi:heat shock protein HspQ
MKYTTQSQNPVTADFSVGDSVSSTLHNYKGVVLNIDSSKPPHSFVEWETGNSYWYDNRHLIKQNTGEKNDK